MAKISLLGSDEKVKWHRGVDGITITPPSKPVFSNPEWPVMFRLDLK